jgi:hypothetical protein
MAKARRAWSEWKDFDIQEPSTIPFKRCCGVYQIRAVTPKYSKAIAIQRLLGTDPTGILLIGHGEREGIAKRVEKNTLNQRGYAGMKEKMQQKMPHGLQFRAMRLPGKKEAEAQEHRLLEKYRQEFGEYPPFNLNGGRQR